MRYLLSIAALFACFVSPAGQASADEPGLIQRLNPIRLLRVERAETASNRAVERAQTENPNIDVLRERLQQRGIDPAAIDRRMGEVRTSEVRKAVDMRPKELPKVDKTGPIFRICPVICPEGPIQIDGNRLQVVKEPAAAVNFAERLGKLEDASVKRDTRLLGPPVILPAGHNALFAPDPDARISRIPAETKARFEQRLQRAREVRTLR